MPKIAVQEGQLTIPVSEEVRESLRLQPGDELAVHVVAGSVVYTPAATDAREGAWQRILAVTDQVLPSPDQAAKPIEQVEREITEEVHAFRRARRDGEV